MLRSMNWISSNGEMIFGYAILNTSVIVKWYQILRWLVYDIQILCVKQASAYSQAALYTQSSVIQKSKIVPTISSISFLAVKLY